MQLNMQRPCARWRSRRDHLWGKMLFVRVPAALSDRGPPDSRSHGVQPVRATNTSARVSPSRSIRRRRRFAAWASCKTAACSPSLAGSNNFLLARIRNLLPRFAPSKWHPNATAAGTFSPREPGTWGRPPLNYPDGENLARTVETSMIGLRGGSGSILGSGLPHHSAS